MESPRELPPRSNGRLISTWYVVQPKLPSRGHDSWQHSAWMSMCHPVLFPPNRLLSGVLNISQCFLKECPPWCGWACPLCLRSCLPVSGLVLSPFVHPFVWDDVSALSPVLSDLPCLLPCLPLCGTTCPPCLRSCLPVSGLALCPIYSSDARAICSNFWSWIITTVVVFFLGFALQPCLSLPHIALSINLQTWNLLVVTNYVWVVGSAQRRSGWLPRMIDLTTWCNYHWSNHHLFSNNNKINHIFCQ